MDKYDDFNKPDREGFNQLLHAPIVHYRGMIFLKTFFEPTKIEHRLKTESPEKIQRELNHIHLFLYTTDIMTQRKWADELKIIWSKRFESEFQNLKVLIELDDNGQEIIVTFWLSSHNKDVTE